MSMLTPVKFTDDDCRADVKDSDSEKSLSTNENSCPTSGASSGLNSANGTGATSPKAMPQKVRACRVYESAKHEVHRIEDFPTLPNSEQKVKSASPNLHKQAAISKRQKLSPVMSLRHSEESSGSAAPTQVKCPVKRCLF